MLEKSLGKIAIVGATGNVGRQLVGLFMRRHPNHDAGLRLFASAKSAGTQLQLDGRSFSVQNVDDYDFKDCRLVIDASSAYRLDPTINCRFPGQARGQ